MKSFHVILASILTSSGIYSVAYFHRTFLDYQTVSLPDSH